MDVKNEVTNNLMDLNILVEMKGKQWRKCLKTIKRNSAFLEKQKLI